jgi:hypothetical protein
MRLFKRRKRYRAEAFAPNATLPSGVHVRIIDGESWRIFPRGLAWRAAEFPDRVLRPVPAGEYALLEAQKPAAPGSPASNAPTPSTRSSERLGT